MKLEITLGADPELMLVRRDDRKIVSSIPVLKRNKNNPIDLGDGIRTYSDNVLVEAAFPPSRSIEGAVETMRKALVRIHEKLGKNYELLPQASHVYDGKELGKKGEKNPAWEVGCSPNFDVYADAMNMPGDFSSGLRTGSFHIHIGNANYRNPRCGDELMSVESKQDAIKIMDIFVGCASVLFDKDPTAPARRALYGKAGEYRPTDYGVEYRCLGNYGLRSPELTRLVFELAGYAMTHIRNGTAKDVLKSVDPIKVQLAINDNDATLAESILYKAGLPAKLMERVKTPRNPDFLQDWSI